MSTTRREFLDKLAVGSHALGALPLAAHASTAESASPSAAQQGGYDTAWGSRLTGKLKAVFDVPEIEDGWGVYRAAGWGPSHEATLGTARRDISTVLVLRHHGIQLAMSQAYWDKYGTGKAMKINHPLTGQPTDKNPALLQTKDGMPERFGALSLADIQSRGGLVLGCALAFEFYIVGAMAAADKITEAEAWTRARSMLAPGVVLQPTGVFAVLRAQEAGCMYIRAS
jgi:hypothetical protein